MKSLPRGIDPELLLSQVKNTMPYLLVREAVTWDDFPPAKVLRDFQDQSEKNLYKTLSHFDYFKLCVSSHFLTCATPVPTDVDNQIRFKLWPGQLPLETALQMSDFVLSARNWDFKRVSARFAYGAKGSEWQEEAVHGHMGEWFTISSAAYCALKQYGDSLEAREKRKNLLENIADEVRRHSEIFGSLWRAQDGLGCLKASASISHNFGDLDRVMDMWELSVDDPLRLEFYKLGVVPFDSNRKLRYLGRLWVAGELYKSPIDQSSMAFENHRHFALRKPRCLRKGPSFLVPNGPFFDSWGSQVAQGLMDLDGNPTSETREVVDALVAGWERLPKTVGYGRALKGISEIHPDLKLKAVGLESQQEFEEKWNQAALKLMDDIPSRA